MPASELLTRIAKREMIKGGGESTERTGLGVFWGAMAMSMRHFCLGLFSVPVLLTVII